MDVVQLSYFIEAAQTLSFRKVSQRYYVSQPSISNSISNLEAEFGAKLFVRNSQGVSLTAEGHELLPYAIQVLESLKIAKSRIRDVQSSNKGTVCVACVPGASPVLAECLKASIARYPEIYVDIKIVDGNGQMAALDEERFDFTFGCYRNKPSSGKSEVHLARRGFLSLILPRSQYPETGQVQFPELTGTPFIAISPSGGPLLYDQAMVCCKNRGLLPHIVSFYDDAHTILTAVSAGVGISVLPPNLATSMPGDIIAIPFEGEDAKYDAYVSWKKDSSNNAAHRFMQVVKERLGLKK